MAPLSWQAQLARAIRCPEALLRYVGLSAGALGYSQKALRAFPLRAPHAYADRMQKGDPEDPLLRQVFPLRAEEQDAPGFVADPLGEAGMRRAPGLLQKYQGRVLAITTGACAIHCRYCFRRHFPYQDAAMTRARLSQSLAAITADKSITEVILSGGDPLSLSDLRLLDFFEALAAIPHIRRIRFHTRLPIVLPARISAGLTARLAAPGKTVIFVLHINHANEIDEAVMAAVALLRQAGILLFNQSVLLRGVNDSVARLISLVRRARGKRDRALLSASARPGGRRGPLRRRASTRHPAAQDHAGQGLRLSGAEAGQRRKRRAGEDVVAGLVKYAV